jgi:hypothetical protein
MNKKLYFSSTIDNRFDVFNQPLDKQRYLYFSDKFNKAFNQQSFIEKDNHYYFSDEDKKICFNVKSGLYVTNTRKSGFTFDLKKSKLKIWFGHNVQTLEPHYKDIFKALNIDWIKPDLYKIIRKGSLEKILANKITNPRDLAKYYIRYSLKASKQNINISLFLKYIKSRYSVSEINYYINLSQDVNAFLNYILHVNEKDKVRSNILADMSREATILNKKINFNWSKKRFLEEHTKMSKQVMELDLLYIGNTKLKYNGSLDFIPYSGKLLTTEKEVFVEGSRMHHCIYTGYWSQIKNRSYFVISGMSNNKRFTVGINCQKNYNKQKNKTDSIKIVINQIYSIRNSPVDDEIKLTFKKWIETRNVQDFFKNNLKDGNVISDDVLPFVEEFDEVPAILQF